MIRNCIIIFPLKLAKDVQIFASYSAERTMNQIRHPNIFVNL